MRRLALVAMAILGLGCAADSAADDGDDGGGNGGGGGGGSQADAAPGGGGGGSEADAAPGGAEVAPGGSCSCDADCASAGGQAGVCVYGICMVRAAAECSAAGSQDECPDGSRCWGLQGREGSICWPDCDATDCDGTCDGDGSCVPADGDDCDYTCGSYCFCEDGQCADGLQCIGGQCVEPSGDGPGPGPGPDCAGLPPRDCTDGAGACGELVTLDPRTTPHYDDYPINGETAGDQYRSYLRRDLAMLLDYATAKTLCKADGWDGGIGGPLGFGDMSEADGAIPGTSVGSPGHPANTHTNGFDIDLGYYQRGTADNRLRPICEHTDGGSDAYHCTAEPHLLDVWRTAMFLGVVFESPRVRVIGVDGRVGPLVEAALGELCATGWLSDDACDNIVLAYEETDTGLGWFRFHHHHAHISLRQSGFAPVTGVPAMDPAQRSTRKRRPRYTPPSAR